MHTCICCIHTDIPYTPAYSDRQREHWEASWGDGDFTVGLKVTKLIQWMPASLKKIIIKRALYPSCSGNKCIYSYFGVNLPCKKESVDCLMEFTWTHVDNTWTQTPLNSTNLFLKHSQHLAHNGSRMRLIPILHVSIHQDYTRHFTLSLVFFFSPFSPCVTARFLHVILRQWATEKPNSNPVHMSHMLYDTKANLNGEWQWPTACNWYIVVLTGRVKLC